MKKVSNWLIIFAAVIVVQLPEIIWLLSDDRTWLDKKDKYFSLTYWFSSDSPKEPRLTAELVTLIACADQRQKIETRLRGCTALIEKGEPEGRYPGRYFRERGSVYFLMGKFDDAIQDFDEAIRLEAGNALYWFDRGNVYSKKQDWPKAIADFNEAIRLDAGNARHWLSRGRVYSKKQEWPKAISDFNEAIKIDPRWGEAFYERATVYTEKGEYELALKDFDLTLEKFGERSRKAGPVFAARGSVHEKLGRQHDTVDDYWRAYQRGYRPSWLFNRLKDEGYFGSIK